MARGSKFEASLGYTVRPYLKNNQILLKEYLVIMEHPQIVEGTKAMKQTAVVLSRICSIILTM